MNILESISIKAGKSRKHAICHIRFSQPNPCRKPDGVEERYSYDQRNRLVSFEKGGMSSGYEYDAAGNLLRDDRASYTYDAFNRQTRVETFDGNIQINRYDAEGLRHEMEENGRLLQFIFRDKEVVTEEREAGMVRYIRPHELLASDAEHARTYYHYASDEMESITHSPDMNAAAKYPGSNSGSGWTAQIKVGRKLLGQDRSFYKRAGNFTHIPLKAGE